MHDVTSFYLCKYLDVNLLREGIVSFLLLPNNSHWCLVLAKVSNSSKSSNLCWFSDKPQHLVVLAWDAACTVGCCKVFAWSGPGTPHVIGNSLNSAHLGRQCRLDPLIFCCSSQPASQPLLLPPPTYPAATVPGCSPTAIPALP